MLKFVMSAVKGVFIPGTKGFVMYYLAYADDVTLTLHEVYSVTIAH